MSAAVPIDGKKKKRYSGVPNDALEDHQQHSHSPTQTTTTTKRTSASMPSSSTLIANNQNNSRLLKFNIGGKKYTTTVQTLSKRGENLLTKLISGLEVDHKAQLDEEGSYFIDRDGDLFTYVLNFLRDGVVHGPAKEVQAELDFYGISYTRKPGTVQSKSSKETTPTQPNQSSTNTTHPTDKHATSTTTHTTSSSSSSKHKQVRHKYEYLYVLRKKLNGPWEHPLLSRTYSSDTSEEQWSEMLNEFGIHGWKLCTTRFTESYTFNLIFRRKIIDGKG